MLSAEHAADDHILLGKHGLSPRVWLLPSYRAGENSQLRGLAAAIGWPTLELPVAHRWCAGLIGLFRLVSTAGTTADTAEFYRAPWPDLLLTAGLKNEPLAQWIQRASGGQTRTVVLGRTWAGPARFDLTITTPQYRLAAHPRVLHNALTLHGLTPGILAQARREAANTFGQMPAPRTVVLLGGNAGPFVLGTNAIRTLTALLTRRQARHGGTIAITTSARTSAGALGALAAIPRDWFCHRYGEEGDRNPYLGLLAWADEIVVSADSVAMLSEALATGKPVYVFDPRTTADQSLTAVLHPLLTRFGPSRLGRDVDLVLQAAIGTGQAALLEDGATANANLDPPAVATTTAARVRALV